MLNYDDLEAEVRRLAAEKPDYVYPGAGVNSVGSCFYNPRVDGATACIWGQAFINLGHPVPEDFEHGPVQDVINELVRGATPEQLKWAGHVQELQDTGVPWGKAITGITHEEF